MKRILLCAVLSAGLTSIAGAADVGVSIQFAQPGVFGRVDIGQFPQPQVIVPQPVIIEPGPPAMPRPEPLYLWVPLEHRKHWDRYCREYHACGHPVYFVNHVWYKNHVMAHQESGQGHHEGHDERRGEGEHHDHGHEQDDHGRH